MVKELKWQGNTKCPNCSKKVTGLGDPDDPICPLCGGFLDNPSKLKGKSKG